MMAEMINQKGHDKGPYTLQATLGCELQRNGSTRGFWHLGYEGRNLLTFDQKTLTWTMDVPFTQQKKTFWEPRAPKADLVKTFLDETCPARLQRHLASLSNVLPDTGTDTGLPPSISLFLRDVLNPEGDTVSYEQLGLGGKMFAQS